MMPRIRPAVASPDPPSDPPLALMRWREALPKKIATGPRMGQQIMDAMPSTSARVAWLSFGGAMPGVNGAAYPGAAYWPAGGGGGVYWGGAYDGGPCGPCGGW